MMTLFSRVRNVDSHLPFVEAFISKPKQFFIKCLVLTLTDRVDGIGLRAPGPNAARLLLQLC